MRNFTVIAVFCLGFFYTAESNTIEDIRRSLQLGTQNGKALKKNKLRYKDYPKIRKKKSRTNASRSAVSYSVPKNLEIYQSSASAQRKPASLDENFFEKIAKIFFYLSALSALCFVISGFLRPEEA